jgi:Zn finger protein HypA/HybF involved in hydrogenase expression
MIIDDEDIAYGRQQQRKLDAEDNLIQRLEQMSEDSIGKEAAAELRRLREELAVIIDERVEMLCEKCRTIHPPQKDKLFPPCPTCGNLMRGTSFNLRTIKQLREELAAIKAQPAQEPEHDIRDLIEEAYEKVAVISGSAFLSGEKCQVGDRERLHLIACEVLGILSVAKDSGFTTGKTK